MREVEVVDSDVAPVRGLSLSIARESSEGQGQGEEAEEPAMDIPSTVRLCIEPSTPPTVTTPLHLLEARTARVMVSCVKSQGWWSARASFGAGGPDAGPCQKRIIVVLSCFAES